MSRTQEMELWLGPSHHGSAFESDEHRREVWFRFRDRILRIFGKDGRRPFGWWYYESAAFGVGHGRHPGEHERSILFEFPEFADVLSEAERSQLEARWREGFNKTWREGFSYSHEGRIFSGDVARELAWVAMDLPVVLHDKWMAERQQRAQVIHKLQEESQQEAVAETGGPHEVA